MDATNDRPDPGTDQRTCPSTNDGIEYETVATQLATEIGARLIECDATITAAESCTGGLFAGALTSVPGSSAWFKGSLVTYANDTKQALADVPASTLDEYGAVSEPTVIAMAIGAARALDADVAVAISGIAGPGGAVPGKPVGMVWVGVTVSGQSARAVCHQFEGGRVEVREQAVTAALRATLFGLSSLTVAER